MRDAASRVSSFSVSRRGFVSALGGGVALGVGALQAVAAAGKFKFVTAEGQSVQGPIPATGNTNTRGFFKPDVRTFLKRWVLEGPTHHFALGIGHRAKTIQKIAEALGIESVIVGDGR